MKVEGHECGAWCVADCLQDEILPGAWPEILPPLSRIRMTSEGLRDHTHTDFFSSLPAGIDDERWTAKDQQRVRSGPNREGPQDAGRESSDGRFHIADSRL